ncbi:hypothetical protein MIND_00652200 [Mycena indigotica]|uniref:Uncharacterized protein n=1 Tax=Mycena indigotica TaxID=2126181 RepID=A0A8H6W628_9AGAR|nr:uncharacterized protein MIND_00652200 [Mycena indigotica]KAF7304201.1 hypothetical protein MIND_00652200 [Mycena indigotica]
MPPAPVSPTFSLLSTSTPATTPSSDSQAASSAAYGSQSLVFYICAMVGMLLILTVGVVLFRLFAYRLLWFPSIGDLSSNHPDFSTADPPRIFDAKQVLLDEKRATDGHWDHVMPLWASYEAAAPTQAAAARAPHRPPSPLCIKAQNSPSSRHLAVGLLVTMPTPTDSSWEPPLELAVAEINLPVARLSELRRSMDSEVSHSEPQLHVGAPLHLYR